ncbi:hypothetical protein BDQ17DRAFT_1233640 [Cyathus striatus]|nr:hypothetical protein BDQ17DRAFT_1233640 [Cyathus striatus]
MPPRGSEGLDFTPILTHYLFLFTSVLAIASWIVAFVSQAFATAKIGRESVGVLWFAIFLQLFLIIGVLYTLASDSIAMNRFQISVFGAVAIVFSVMGVNMGIFSNAGSLNAMAAGWLILAMINILWVLYFTSEQDSLTLYIFNFLGTGGLTPPSRRRTRTQSSMHGMQSANGYTSNYGGGIGPDNYDSKIGGVGMGGVGGYASGGTAVRSQNSFAGSLDGPNRSINAPTGGTGSIRNAAGDPGSMGGGDNGPSSPLMAGVGAGGSSGTSGPTEGQQPQPPADIFTIKAKALYTYTANAEDPNEISFNKGEILDIVDKTGKWWQARKADGTVGIAPSNYLQPI